MSEEVDCRKPPRGGKKIGNEDMYLVNNPIPPRVASYHIPLRKNPNPKPHQSESRYFKKKPKTFVYVF